MNFSVKAFIKNYFHNFVGNSVYDLLKFFFGLIFTSTIPTFLYNNLTIYRGRNGFVIIAISIFLFLASIFIFLMIYAKKRKYKFRVLSTKVYFEYLKKQIIVTSEIEIKALRPGLDHMYNRYTWFEDEKSQIECLSQDCSITRLPRKDTSFEYNVNFHRKLSKGEVTKYKVKIVNSNINGHFKNFYSREIIAPMDYLSINIVIPSKYNVREILLTTFKGSTYNDFTDTEKIEFINSYEWSIPNPQLGWEYKISW